MTSPTFPSRSLVEPLLNLERPAPLENSQEHTLVRQVARVRFLGQERHTPELDWVAEEQPLEIRINGFAISVLMRTPGHDEDLVRGYLLTEGISQPAHILRIAPCDLAGAEDQVMQVTLHEETSFDPSRFVRHLYVSSSCGVCGKKSIAQALEVAPALPQAKSFDPQVLMAAVQALRSGQPGFAQCGTLHAAALADSEGRLLVTREDVGRHNAVDKSIGWALDQQIELESLSLILSGRASFEMIQKALAARIGIVAAIGGVSSLAVQLAQEAGVQLFGFSSASRLNLYTQPEPLVPSSHV